MLVQKLEEIVEMNLTVDHIFGSLDVFAFLLMYFFFRLRLRKKKQTKMDIPQHSITPTRLAQSPLILCYSTNVNVEVHQRRAANAHSRVSSGEVLMSKYKPGLTEASGHSWSQILLHFSPDQSLSLTFGGSRWLLGRCYGGMGGFYGISSLLL